MTTRLLERRWGLLVTALSLAAALGACGGEDSAPAEPDDEFPADTSEAGIARFIESGSYQSWRHDPAPRASEDKTNIHGDPLQVYFNELAVAGKQSGTLEVGTMVVKELRSSAGELQAIAASLKTDESAWTYYCSGSDVSRCAPGSSGSDAVYAVNELPCFPCHGDAIYAPLPEP